MKLIIIFVTLLLPIAVEVFRDRDGDVHPNSDWKLRGLLCFLVGAITAIVFNGPGFDLLSVLWAAIRYIGASVLLFSALFPYVVNYVHLKRGVTISTHKGYQIPYELLLSKDVAEHVLSHLSNTAWPDKTKWWRWLGVGGRLTVNVILLILSLALICA